MVKCDPRNLNGIFMGAGISLARIYKNLRKGSVVPLGSSPFQRTTNRAITNARKMVFVFFSLHSLYALKKRLVKKKSWGKKCGKMCKSVKNAESVLPFSCFPLVFL